MTYVYIFFYFKFSCVHMHYKYLSDSLIQSDNRIFSASDQMKTFDSDFIIPYQFLF